FVTDFPGHAPEGSCPPRKAGVAGNEDSYANVTTRWTYHQRPSPSRWMTHSWSPRSAISARNRPITWCNGSCVNTWTKTSRHETVEGRVSICQRWTAVVLPYSRVSGSTDPKVTARRRSFPRFAHEAISSSRRGTSDFRK